jgi:hypothetical protein
MQFLISIATVVPASFTPSNSNGGSAGVIVGVTLMGLALLATTDWVDFCFAHTWLALRGSLPLRLMKFLNNAHERGVLRQVGGLYQFRHPRMGVLLTVSKNFESHKSA